MKKRFLSFLMVLVILTINIVPTASAEYPKQVIVSIPAQTFQSSYSIYAYQNVAENNPIVVYVSEDEFPVYATITANDTKEYYQLDGYGTHIISVSSISSSDIVFGFFTCGLTWLFACQDYYAVIDIQRSETTTDPIFSADTPEYENTSEPSDKSDTSLEPLDEVEDSKVNSQELDDILQAVFTEADYPYLEDISSCKQYLEDYFSGNWDGMVLIGPEGHCHSINPYSHQYILSANDSSVTFNIDYFGPLEVYNFSVDNCSFVIDMSSWTVEKWQFFQMQDSWQIPKYEDKDITYDIFSSKTYEDSYRIIWDADLHCSTYLLRPNHEVIEEQ